MQMEFCEKKERKKQKDKNSIRITCFSAQTLETEIQGKKMVVGRLEKKRNRIQRHYMKGGS